MGLDVFEKPRLYCAEFLHIANGQQRFLRAKDSLLFPGYSFQFKSRIDDSASLAFMKRSQQPRYGTL